MQYKSRIVTEAVGITQDLLRQWLKRGYIEVSTRASGPGSSHLFTLNHIIRLSVFKELIDSGLGGRNAHRIAFSDELRDLIDKAITHDATGTLLTRAAAVYIAAFEKGGHIFVYSAENQGQFVNLYHSMAEARLVHIVNLTRIAEEVKSKLQDITS